MSDKQKYIHERINRLKTLKDKKQLELQKDGLWRTIVQQILSMSLSQIREMYDDCMYQNVLQAYHILFDKLNPYDQINEKHLEQADHQMMYGSLYRVQVSACNGEFTQYQLQLAKHQLLRSLFERRPLNSFWYLLESIILLLEFELQQQYSKISRKSESYSTIRCNSHIRYPTKELFSSNVTRKPSPLKPRDYSYEKLQSNKIKAQLFKERSLQVKIQDLPVAQAVVSPKRVQLYQSIPLNIEKKPHTKTNNYYLSVLLQQKELPKRRTTPSRSTTPSKIMNQEVPDLFNTHSLKIVDKNDHIIQYESFRAGEEFNQVIEDITKRYSVTKEEILTNRTEAKLEINAETVTNIKAQPVKREYISKRFQEIHKKLQSILGIPSKMAAILSGEYEPEQEVLNVQIIAIHSKYMNEQRVLIRRKEHRLFLISSSDFYLIQMDTLEILKDAGIPRQLLHSSKVDVEHLICPLCQNILWKPVACGQDRCFQSFCEVCINKYIREGHDDPQLIQNSLYSQSLIVPHQIDNNDSQQFTSSSSSEGEDHDWNQQFVIESVHNLVIEPNCPKCKRPFKRTSIPIIHNLLDAIELSCIYQDCKTKLQYEMFLKHITNCPFRKMNCSGCNQEFLQSEILLHEANCELFITACDQCQLKMTRADKPYHKYEVCIQQQFRNKDKEIEQLLLKIDILQSKNGSLENKIDQLSKGDFESINHFAFKTSFSQNYQFSVSQYCEAKLIKSSFNHVKQKNDFLHFYINHKIKTQSILGVQWRIKIQTLQGNLLLGICSTLCHYSVDYIINRLGETKKKEWNENKYKHLRKANFTFNEGDIMLFQFMPLSQCLRITNETKHLVGRFENQEIIEMGESFYSFFSLECQGDTILFL